MQRAVRQQVNQLVTDRHVVIGRLLNEHRHADDDVAEQARDALESLVLVDRKRQHVGGLVLAAMLAVELLHLEGVDEDDADLNLPHALCRQDGVDDRGHVGLGHATLGAIVEFQVH